MCALCWTQQPGGPKDLPSRPANDPCPLLPSDATPASSSGKPASPRPVWDVAGSSCRKQDSPASQVSLMSPLPAVHAPSLLSPSCVPRGAPCPRGAGTRGAQCKQEGLPGQEGGSERLGWHQGRGGSGPGLEGGAWPWREGTERTHAECPEVVLCWVLLSVCSTDRSGGADKLTCLPGVSVRTRGWR